MVDYHLITPLSPLPLRSPPLYSFFKAHSPTLAATVLIRFSSCSSLGEAEVILRATLAKVAEKGFQNEPIDGFVEERTGGEVAVGFVWEKQGEELDPEITSEIAPREDTFKSSYREKTILAIDPQTNSSLKSAICSFSSNSVVIKTYRLAGLEAANQVIHEALVLARAAHPRTVKLADFSLRPSKNSSFKASIVTEKSHIDLLTDLQLRLKAGSPYTEQEVLRMIADVASSLYHAKTKLTNVVRNSHTGDYKLAGYGTRLPGEPQNRCVEMIETCSSPEVLKGKAADWFAADVFSLGMCALQLSSGRLPRLSGADNLAEVESKLRKELAQTRAAVQGLILMMLQVDPRNRPMIELVHEEAVRILADDHPPKDSEAYASLYESQSLSEQASGRHLSAAILLEKSWKELTRIRDPTAISLGLRLGDIYCLRLSMFQPATDVYSQTLALASDLSPESEPVISLRIARIGVSFYREAYTIAVSESSDLLQSFTDRWTAEHYWCLAYYHVMSHWGLGDYPSGTAAYEHLSHRQFSIESSKALVYRLFLAGILAFSRKQYSEVQQIGFAVQRICQMHFPTFILAGELLRGTVHLFQHSGNIDMALQVCEQANEILGNGYPRSIANGNNLSQWAMLLHARKQWKKAGKTHKKAHFVYFSSFPASIHTANNLNNWANALEKVPNFEKSLRKFADAHALYAQFHPVAMDTAINLNNWANLLASLSKLSESEEKYASAHQIYSEHYSTHVNFAINLMNWAMLCDRLGKLTDAEAKHSAAHSVLIADYRADIGTAQNVSAWAGVCMKLGKLTESGEKFSLAHGLLSQYFPTDLHFASNTSSWALLCKLQGDLPTALQKYESAQRLYDDLFCRSEHAACNLNNWALACSAGEDWENAERKHQQADAVFSEQFPDSLNTGENLFNWGVVLGKVGKWREAEEKHARAHLVYKERAGWKQVGDNLFNWASCWKEMREDEKAVEMMKEALKAYYQANSEKDVRDTLEMVRKLEAKDSASR